MQLAVGVFVDHEPMPPARLAGFAVVWVALGVFTLDSLRTARGTARQRRATPVPVEA
jgi:chloramphenicol-sensitive protein RarD